MITAVTTFHREGLDLYGQRFLNSFANNVDKRVKLIVYAEDCEPVNPDQTQITIVPQTNLKQLIEFKNKWQNVPKANGKCPFPEKRPRDHHKEFKWDAIRFANKTYAVFETYKSAESKWVVWIDADTFVHSPISYKQFEDLLPDDKWITFVGRGRGTQTWPECGFYGLNRTNDTCKKFMQQFELMYEDADKGIFTLDEWHDSFVFGYILKKIAKLDTSYHDYSKNIYNKTAKTGGGGHPLINSELGKYFDHMKGSRKTQRKSARKDLMQQRTEKYWIEI